jgi:hypothetical protein
MSPALSLQAMPFDIRVAILSQLSSLQDLVSLQKTCKELHHPLVTHSRTIYTAVAPRHFAELGWTELLRLLRVKQYLTLQGQQRDHASQTPSNSIRDIDNNVYNSRKPITKSDFKELLELAKAVRCVCAHVNNPLNTWKYDKYHDLLQRYNGIHGYTIPDHVGVGATLRTVSNHFAVASNCFLLDAISTTVEGRWFTRVTTEVIPGPSPRFVGLVFHFHRNPRWFTYSDLRRILRDLLGCAVEENSRESLRALYMLLTPLEIKNMHEHLDRAFFARLF